MKKILAVARKDILVYFSDRRAMIISLIVPIAIASFFAMVMGSANSSQGPQKIKTLIVNEDSDPLTTQIVADLAKKDSIEKVDSNREAALAKVRNGEFGIAVIFPKDFARQAKTGLFVGDPADVEVYYDPTKGTERAVIQGALAEVVMQDVSRAGMAGGNALENIQRAVDNAQTPQSRAAWQGFLKSYANLQAAGTRMSGGAGGGMKQPFRLKESALTASRDPDADGSASRGHIFSGMAMQGILFFAIEAAMAIQRDKASGIWARMKAAPISSSGILLGRGVGSAVIAFFVLSAVFAFGMAAMGIRVHGSWLGMLLVMVASALMTACFGLLVASIGKSESQSRGLSVLAVLLMSMLGGAWFPTWLMPKFMQTVSLFVPVRWAVDGFDGVLWRGQSLTQVLGPVAGLTAFAIVFAGAAAIRFRKA